MVTQNTSTAGAATAARHVRLSMPEANQQVVIDNIAGVALDMGFPSDSAQLAQSGQDLVFQFENGGSIVLSNFFGLFESNQLPAFTLEDGQSLPGDAFLAALREDLLPAAGPGAGAGAAGGGVGDYADDAGNLINGVDRLDPLGTGTFGQARLPGIEATGPLDTADGTLVIGLNSTVGTFVNGGEEGEQHPYFGDVVPAGTYTGAFEDWQPNQHYWNSTPTPAVFDFNFTPADNEVLNSITFTGPIPGGHLLVNGVEVLPDGAGNYVIAAADIGNVSLLPNADSGTDVPLTGYATITDPDSGLTGTIPFSFTAVVDAAADRPWAAGGEVKYGPFESGDGDVVIGDQIKSKDMGTHEHDNGGNGGYTAANPDDHRENHTDDGAKPIEVTLRGEFGDYQDGSEQHFLFIEVKEGWTYESVKIGDEVVLLGEGSIFLTKGSDIPASDTLGHYDINPNAYYYVIPAGSETIVDGTMHMYQDPQGVFHQRIEKAVTLTMYAPDEPYQPENDSNYSARTTEGGNGGYEGDYREHFVVGAVAVDTDSDGSLTAVNNESLTIGGVTIGVAPADGSLCVVGEHFGHEDNNWAQNVGWTKPTGDIDLDFKFHADDNEVLDALHIRVLNTTAKVYVGHHEAEFVSDGEGGGYYVVPGNQIGDVTLVPQKDSDVDVKLSITAQFHDPDSGDTASKTVGHTVYMDAVADMPVHFDSSVTYIDEPGGPVVAEPTAADPGGTMQVTLAATFGDVLDGSERHYLGIEYDKDWGYQAGGEVIKINGTKYMVYDVTSMDDAGRVSLQLTMGVPNTNDRESETFKTVAYSKEKNTSGAEWNDWNNEAYNFGTLKVVSDGADACLRVTASGYEDWMPNAHTGDMGIVAAKLNVGFYPDDTSQSPEHREILDSVTITFAGKPFTLVVGSDPLHPDRVIEFDGSGDTVTLTKAESEHLYIKAPANSATDIPIGFTAKYHDPDSGDTGSYTFTNPVKVVIDAVADKPTGLDETVNYGTGHTAADPGDGADVSVTLTATFGDVLDGSEAHFLGIEYKEGWTYPGGLVAINPDDGVKYVFFNVTAIDNGGTVNLPLLLGAPDTDGSHTATFKTVAVAMDGDAWGDGRITQSNDLAYTYGSVDIAVDGAGGTLEVTSGNGGYEDWMPNANTGDFTESKTALSVSFDNADNEVLDKLIVKYDGVAFKLVVGAAEYTIDSTHQQVELTGAQLTQSLYVKTALHSDVDVPLKVTAEFHDPTSGDTGSKTADYTVRVDAVADKPTGVTVDVNDSGDDGSTFHAGETGTVKVTANFADIDGSEDHKVVLEIPVGFSVDTTNLHGGTWNGTARTVTWDVGHGGSLNETISVTNNSAGSGNHNFKVTASAEETHTSGYESSTLLNNNNHAETTANDTAVVNNGGSVGWYIKDAVEHSNIVVEGDQGPGSGPVMAFTVGYSGYTLQPGESVSIVLTGPASGSTADVGDFVNASNNFAAWLNAVTNGPNDGVEYNPSTNTLTFSYIGANTPTSVTFYPEVKGDKFVEPDEVIKFVLSDPKYNGQPGGNIVDGIEDGTIKNDDSAPVGGDALTLTLHDVHAAGTAVDTHSDTLDFTVGSQPLAYSFDISGAGHAPSVTGLGGTGITWSGDGTGTLVGKIGGVTAITLQLSSDNAGHVQVSATLADPLKHANGVADVVVNNLYVKGADGVNAPVYGKVTVNVDDASPTATPDVNDYSGGMTTNLVIMMDRSGSMDWDSGVGTLSRWDVAMAGMKELIDAYAHLGSVNVKIVDFADGSASSSSWYYNATSGTVTYLNSKTPDGGTSYDAATGKMMADVANGMPPADKSLVYFLSDGNPDPASAGLDSGEQGAWEAFLAKTPIDGVYAFGIGTDVGTQALGTVAWNADGSADKVVVVDNLNDFSQHLLDTVPVTGNLLTNDISGADGGKVLYSVTVDGVTHYIGESNATTHKLVLDLHDGKGSLTVDFDDGSYVFTPGSTPVGTEVIGYGIKDADGSIDNSTLTLNLRAAELWAHDNHAAALPGSSTVTTDTFSSGLNGWSDTDDSYGTISRENVGGGDKELMLQLEYAWGTSVSSSKTFEVTKGDTISFDWRAQPFAQLASGSISPHDDDRFLVVITGPDGTQTFTPYVCPVNGAGGSGRFTSPPLGATGSYTVALKVVDGRGNDNFGHLRVFVDDVVFTHAVMGAALMGNVVTDHIGADFADQIGGQTAYVTEVNGVAIDNDGQFHTVVGDYGTISINAFGQYEYHANPGTNGHEDAFVYKLTGGTDSDYATLNVHIGDANVHNQASAENWTGTTGGDFHLGGTGADTLNGGNGDDVIFGNYGQDIIHGNAGNDTLHGGAGNDTLYGDAGNDILVGGQGSDILYGDDPAHTVHGADTFIWKAEDFTGGANDTVKDFNPGENDVLRFADVLLDHDGNSGNGLSTSLIANGDLVQVGATNNVQLTLHHGGESQTVILEGALANSTLQAIEQHILTNKIITEHS